jgi:hypothetical protein
MPDRSKDWFAQAQRDLRHAVHACDDRDYEWSCFSAQEAAEKVVKAVFLYLHGEGWGHSVSRLLSELDEKPLSVRTSSMLPRHLTNIIFLRVIPTVLPVGCRATITQKRMHKRQSQMPNKSSGSVKVFFTDKDKVLCRLKEYVRRLKAE